MTQPNQWRSSRSPWSASPDVTPDQAVFLQAVYHHQEDKYREWLDATHLWWAAVTYVYSGGVPGTNSGPSTGKITDVVGLTRQWGAKLRHRFKKLEPNERRYLLGQAAAWHARVRAELAEQDAREDTE